MPTAKKVFEAPSGEDVIMTGEAHSHSPRSLAADRRKLPWPLAGLTILLLSLLLWAGIVAVVLFALD